MPLHLLGKKSWNVYNADNVARVRRDEAAAAAADEAAEQRMQEADAARRLAILRGQTPPPLPEPEPDIDPSDKKFARRDKDSATGFSSRKRKRAGEDDTDFEMRLAFERAEMGRNLAAELAGPRAGDGATKQGDVHIVDGQGHIDLIGAPPPSSGGSEKNAEYEREKERKKRELEDQYTMRFSNAAGRDGFAAGDPWYAKAGSRSRTFSAASTRKDLISEIGSEATTKNVWGKEDPKRKDRETQRLVSSDPLAMMKTGAKRVREIEKERRKEVEEREKALKELRKEERREEKRRRRDRHDKGEDGSRHRHRHGPYRSEHSERKHDDRDLKERNGHHRQHVRDEKRDRSEGRYHPRVVDRGGRRGEGPSHPSHPDAEEGLQHL
ncbi:hypothetical protein BD289DRAFT_253908 [Coniella lustricola]|uniref:CBF1-interacting co-repressor CIR N-terminal domain-containing protein n=1 Tax=Coniella lustricola TaxID=2025994 RepID=A0A2T3A867_9PEZI|nr:hypothetical protein BD289DRAFT_253908 [Coniella lustricola]